MVLALIAIGATYIAIRSGEPATKWGAAAVGVLLVISIIGYRLGWGGGKRTAPVTNTGHHRDLWDAAPYVCIHGYPPHKVKRDGRHVCAYPTGHDLQKFPTAPTLAERHIMNPKP